MPNPSPIPTPTPDMAILGSGSGTGVDFRAPGARNLTPVPDPDPWIDLSGLGVGIGDGDGKSGSHRGPGDMHMHFLAVVIPYFLLVPPRPAPEIATSGLESGRPGTGTTQEDARHRGASGGGTIVQTIVQIGFLWAEFRTKTTESG